MTKQLPVVALRTDVDVTIETIRELFNHVDTNAASNELQTLTEAVTKNPDDVIDTGDRHPDRTKDEPCPECGAEELMFLQTVNDIYTCTGEDTLPGSGGDIYSTVLVGGTECNETL